MAKSIISCGVYLPYLRIKREEYIKALGSCSAGMREKTVPDIDEDVVTMAVEASRDALAGLDAAKVGVLTLASTSFPYQEKALAGTLVEALGLGRDVLATQHGHSTLAGTEAFLAALGLLDQTEKQYALVVVSDAPASAPSVDMEHGFGAAACAFVLTRDEPGLEFEGVYAQSREAMGLRYRLPGERDVRDIGVRTYASQDYNETVSAAITGLLGKLGRKPADYRHVVLHQVDARTASALAKKMGCVDDQVKEGEVYSYTGDTGACSPLLGLCRVLESAVPGDSVLVASYAPGSGSHALSFTLRAPLQKSVSFRAALENKRYITYIQYLKQKRSI